MGAVVLLGITKGFGNATVGFLKAEPTFFVSELIIDILIVL